MICDNIKTKIGIITLVFLSLVILSIITSSSKADSVSDDSIKIYNQIEDAIAILPSSLQYIDTEAFSGTNINSIAFENGLFYIGDYAFWNVVGLHDVVLPDSVDFIGTRAFSESTIIHGKEGSYTQLWAKENGYQFVVDTISSDKVISPDIHAEQILLLLFIVLPVNDRKVILCRRIRKKIKSMRPQDRPELYPINYRFP